MKKQLVSMRLSKRTLTLLRWIDKERHKKHEKLAGMKLVFVPDRTMLIRLLVEEEAKRLGFASGSAEAWTWLEQRMKKVQ